MAERPRDEEIFEKLANAAENAPRRRTRAPARLKSRIYSALIERAAAEGELRSLPETKAAGRGLCVFEELMRAAPLRGETEESQHLPGLSCSRAGRGSGKSADLLGELSLCGVQETVILWQSDSA